MKWDIHTHTTYSRIKPWGYDALNSPAEMIKAAIKKGLDGIVITDHNTIKGALAGLKYVKAKKLNFSLIIGEEIRTTSGDVLAIGISEEIRPYLSLEETIDKIHEQGGVCVAAHPFARFLLGTVLRDKSKKTDAIEVLNACSALHFQNLAAQKFARQNNLVAVAGSDAHAASVIGSAGIICNNPLKDIKNGRVKIFGSEALRKELARIYIRKYIRSIKWLINKQEKRELKEFIRKCEPCFNF